MKFSDIADISPEDVAEHTWSVWKTWRLSQGFRLGGISPGLEPEDTINKRSPHLVDDWGLVSAAGQAYFSQMVALVLGGLQTMNPPEPIPEAPSAKKVLSLLMKSLQAGSSDVEAHFSAFWLVCPEEYRRVTETAREAWVAKNKTSAKKSMKSVWDAMKAL